MAAQRITILEFVERMRRRWVGSAVALQELDVMLDDFFSGRSEETVKATTLTEVDWLVHATISRWRKSDG